MIGTKVGHYEITTHLGSGGMGDVYQATDTRLGRSVAIKFLPEAFSHDTERVARFQREARVLASLNHPNIAAIHGVEEVDSRHFLVMELVPGETVADRTKRGAMPIEEALPIAKQIAEALEEAHEKGIIHRDLKPANIKVTPEGKVKVLDFGLAKAFERGEHAEISLSNSPTISMAATNAGLILGTAAYMSPEQASGRTVDRRSDLWAFGVVLLEMLTGRPVFKGETVSHVVASVLKDEPDWNELPVKTPAPVRKLLLRCLEKDRKRRLDSASVARLEIEEVLAAPAENTPLEVPRKLDRFAWIVAAVFLTAIAVLAVPAFRYFNETVPPELRLEISTPTSPGAFALSPDGMRLAFVPSDNSTHRLWVRPLNAAAAQPLPGTDDADSPFWSPDGRSIGFFANGKLKRIDIAGGMPRILADAPHNTGGAWNQKGIIIFVPDRTTLYQLPATGGDPVIIRGIETGVLGVRYPQFLPDGSHFIYFVRGGPTEGLYIASLDQATSKRIANVDAASVVSPSGFLLFPRQSTLFGQAFDFKTLQLIGNPFSIADRVAYQRANGRSGFSAGSGVVAYVTDTGGGADDLIWVDRSGKTMGRAVASEIRDFNGVELSPDGKQIVIDRIVNGERSLWGIDTARGLLTRYTVDSKLAQDPIWSPDGSRVVFASNRTGFFNLHAKSSNSTAAEELLLESEENKLPDDWSSDGRFLIFRSFGPRTGFDLWILPMFGDKKPFPFLKTSSSEDAGQFSADGKWIAYQSDESGQSEVYVQPFPGPGRKLQISTNGGAQARWNKNGKEIFYVSLDRNMMAASLKASPDGKSLEVGATVPLFPVQIAGRPNPASPAKPQYAVSADGRRFLVAIDQQPTTLPITIIYNWHPDAGK